LAGVAPAALSLMISCAAAHARVDPAAGPKGHVGQAAIASAADGQVQAMPGDGRLSDRVRNPASGTPVPARSPGPPAHDPGWASGSGGEQPARVSPEVGVSPRRSRSQVEPALPVHERIPAEQGWGRSYRLLPRGSFGRRGARRGDGPGGGPPPSVRDGRCGGGSGPETGSAGRKLDRASAVPGSVGPVLVIAISGAAGRDVEDGPPRPARRGDPPSIPLHRVGRARRRSAARAVRYTEPPSGRLEAARESAGAGKTWRARGRNGACRSAKPEFRNPGRRTSSPGRGMEVPGAVRSFRPRPGRAGQGTWSRAHPRPWLRRQRRHGRTMRGQVAARSCPWATKRAPPPAARHPADPPAAFLQHGERLAQRSAPAGPPKLGRGSARSGAQPLPGDARPAAADLDRARRAPGTSSGVPDPRSLQEPVRSIGRH